MVRKLYWHSHGTETAWYGNFCGTETAKVGDRMVRMYGDCMARIFHGMETTWKGDCMVKDFKVWKVHVWEFAWHGDCMVQRLHDMNTAWHGDCMGR
jgi:hypothetical protein